MSSPYFLTASPLLSTTLYRMSSPRLASTHFFDSTAASSSIRLHTSRFLFNSTPQSVPLRFDFTTDAIVRMLSPSPIQPAGSPSSTHLFSQLLLRLQLISFPHRLFRLLNGVANGEVGNMVPLTEDEGGD